MTLLETCEPVFQYACRLNRGVRKGVIAPAHQVRTEIKDLLEDTRLKAAAEPAVAEQFAKVEIILLYFLDAIVRNSRLPYASQWADLAAERGQSAGDEDFFDQLDATLADNSESAAQRLTVFYTCMGLGFAGWYRGQPDHLRRKMSEIASRIRAGLDAERAARVCPEAYDNVNTADLVQPPARKLVGIGIVLAGLAVTVFIANIVLYRERRSDLVRALDAIKQASDPAATAPAGGSR